MTDKSPTTVEELDIATIRTLLPGASGASTESRLRRQCVTRAELQQFLAESPPRHIPQGMSHQFLGNISNFAVFGIMVSLFPLLALALLVFVADAELSWIDYAIFTGIPLLVIFIAAAIFLYRKQKVKVLRCGDLTWGVITEAVCCERDSSSGKSHWVTVKFQLDDLQYCESLYIHGQPGEVAVRYAASGQETNVLVDPGNRKRIAFPDFFEIFDDEVLNIAERQGRPYKYHPT